MILAMFRIQRMLCVSKLRNGSDTHKIGINADSDGLSEYLGASRRAESSGPSGILAKKKLNCRRDNKVPNGNRRNLQWEMDAKKKNATLAFDAALECFETNCLLLEVFVPVAVTAARVFGAMIFIDMQSAAATPASITNKASCKISLTLTQKTKGTYYTWQPIFV